MGDPHRNTGILCSTQGEHRKSILMAMHYHPTLFTKQFGERSLICDGALVRRNGKNSTTERFDFFTRYERRILIHDEVKLHNGTVHMTVVIHNDRFEATTEHLAHNMSNANRFNHLNHLAFLREKSTVHDPPPRMGRQNGTRTFLITPPPFR